MKSDMKPVAKSKKKKKQEPIPSVTYVVDREWFSTRARELKLSLRALSRAVPIDSSSFNRVLKGQRKLHINEFAALATILKVRPVELLKRIGLPVDETKVLIVGKITADGEVSSATPRKNESVDVPPGAPSGLLAYVFDTSHGPLAMWDQCIAYVLPQKGIDVEVVGRLAVVECVGQKHPILATITKGSARGRMKVQPFSGKQAFESDNCSASPVLWIKAA